MARRITRKEMKRDELVETAVDASNWLEENWQTVVKGAVAVAFVGALALLWYWYVGHSRAQAELLLAQGMQKFAQAAESGYENTAEVEDALALFEESASKSGRSQAGRSATYYQGAALLRLGRGSEAIEVLENLSRKELAPTLASATQVLLAEALVAEGQPGRAIGLLEEVADASDAAFPPDQALLLLGKIHMRRGDTNQAREVWQRITMDYPQGSAAMEANRLLEP
jgi:TolA-binding protein